jgi:hypothetical protein
MDRLVRGNPENLEYRNFYGWVLHNLGSALLEGGCGTEGLAAYREAVEQQRQAFAKAPGRFWGDLEDHYLALLTAQRRLGLDAKAVSVAREARAALGSEDEVGPAGGPQTAKHLVFLACLDAMESAPAAPGRAEPSAEESARRRRAAERALGRLRRAVDAGYRDVERLRTEPALGPLRQIAGFDELLRDASFPVDPFTR